MDRSTPSVDWYKEMLKEDPASEVFASLADALYARGSLKEAVRVCRWGLGVHPRHLKARTLLGLCLWRLGDFEGAEHELEIARRSLEDHARIYAVLAEIAQQKGDLDKVRRYLMIYRSMKADGPAAARLQEPAPVSLEKAVPERVEAAETGEARESPDSALDAPPLAAAPLPPLEREEPEPEAWEPESEAEPESEIVAVSFVQRLRSEYPEEDLLEEETLSETETLLMRETFGSFSKAYEEEEEEEEDIEEQLKALELAQPTREFAHPFPEDVEEEGEEGEAAPFEPVHALLELLVLWEDRCQGEAEEAPQAEGIFTLENRKMLQDYLRAAVL